MLLPFDYAIMALERLGNYKPTRHTPSAKLRQKRRGKGLQVIALLSIKVPTESGLQLTSVKEKGPKGFSRKKQNCQAK